MQEHNQIVAQLQAQEEAVKAKRSAMD